MTRSVYFGMKLARKILGQPEADTAFDDLGFPTVPYKPLSGLGAQLLTRWYSHLDARGPAPGLGPRGQAAPWPNSDLVLAREAG